MKHINLYDYEDPDLPEFWGEYYDKINQLIDDYSLEHDIKNKIGILKSIQSVMQQVDYACSQQYIEDNPTYHTVRSELFKQIQSEYVLCNHTFYNSDIDSFSILLANISPDKADKLMSILINNRKLDSNFISKLYGDDDSFEAEAFRSFFIEYEIEFLGGKNSQNFKISGSEGRCEILKIENRGGMAKTAEAALREQHDEFFAPVYAERHTYKQGVSRTLLVTDYYKNGDLLSHSQQEEDSFVRAESASKIFEQMANILCKIEESNAVFLDCKLSNWLLDENKNIIISDTKSLGSAENGKFLYISPGMPVTRDYNPPELSSGRYWSVDKFHAYVLGMNLYQYLTGNPVPQEPENLDTLHVFPNGAIYAALIEGLTTDPEKRMPVRDALNQLREISLQMEQKVTVDQTSYYKGEVNYLKANNLEDTHQSAEFKKSQ